MTSAAMKVAVGVAALTVGATLGVAAVGLWLFVAVSNRT